MPSNFRLAWFIVFMLVIGSAMLYPPIYLYVIPALMFATIYILLNVQDMQHKLSIKFWELEVRLDENGVKRMLNVPTE